MSKLKIGVFGAYRGLTMITVLMNHPHAELTAVCDRYVPALERVREQADKLGLSVALYENFEEFFLHDMDAVVLANYANEHAPFAVRLLDSGRHVLSEVLPCETMAQAVALVEAVERSGKVYAYAENYCYMEHTFEMWRRYERGDIGEVMYGEGEYIHDCSKIWPLITYGDPDHWRNSLFPTFYCTHSLGPLLTITNRRPVCVTGFVTNLNSVTRRLGNRQGECSGIEMVTLDNGAILKSIHGHLKREPDSINYEVYGMKGSMETQRFKPSTGSSEGELMVYREGEKLCEGETETYKPEKQFEQELASRVETHGGSDFYPTHFFIERILGNSIAEQYSIDVYRALDMGICGLLAYRSALAGNVPMKVPNFRNPEEREPYRFDNKCTNPRIASGEDLLPCYPTGSIEYEPEIYDEVRALWEAGKFAE